MTVTNVLQEQAGIQYGSVTDKSEADPRDSMNNVLFTGEFKRGRFDQPMKVLASSIRAVLGYDPDNMTYVAIEDALAAGAPFVWVQRIDLVSNGDGTEIEPPHGSMVMRVSEQVDSVTLAIGGGPFQINWGDGTVGAITEGYVTHEYATRANWRIIIDKEQGSVNPSPMELGTAVGIKEVIAWWGEGYEALRFIDSEEDIPRDKLVKVPSIAPKVFPLERGAFSPIFAGCTKINDPSISKWDVTAWLNLGGMFQFANLFNQPLNWDVSNAGNMNGMFKGAAAFDQDLSSWCVAKVLSEPEEFSAGSPLQPQHMPVWGTCPGVEPEQPPENWDIKYLVNGTWIYESTGPIVQQEANRNNSYRDSATELVISDSVTEIGYGAFSNWVSLTKLTLGENIIAIRAAAFSSLKSVLELTIPDSVEFIGSEAFRAAGKVKNITLGTGVTTIEDYAFTHSYVLDAFIMTGLTPPLVMQYPMLVMSSGSNGYTTGVIFVPDEAYDAYVAAQLPRLRRLSALSTYDFTEPYHWTN